MIRLKTPAEIALMAEGGRRLARVINALAAEVRPGVSTQDLDRRAAELIRAGGDTPAFLGYQPGGAERAYPYTLCASVNDSVVHGLPSARRLAEGDIVKLDLGLVHKGWYVDAAVTVPVGKISAEARKLIAVTREALARGIRAAKPKNALGDIGYAIQSYVERYGFSAVRALTGHGIGKRLHEDPHVYNVGRPGEGDELAPGMVIAIEPMINAGGCEVRQLADDSFVTKDGSLSAHFEHTVAITEKGPRILTAA
jgi:methionyl aminopeptidase